MTRGQKEAGPPGTASSEGRNALVGGDRKLSESGSSDEGRERIGIAPREAASVGNAWSGLRKKLFGCSGEHEDVSSLADRSGGKSKEVKNALIRDRRALSSDRSISPVLDMNNG